MLLGGAVNLAMLYAGRFLTGVAGGMTAASIPVSYHAYRGSKLRIVLALLPHSPGFIFTMFESNVYIYMWVLLMALCLNSCYILFM